MRGDLFFLSESSLQAVEDMAFDRLATLEDVLVKALINSKGLTYGDIKLPPPEAILKFADDELRGINAWIAQNEPEEYAKRVSEYARDVEQSGLI